MAQRTYWSSITLLFQRVYYRRCGGAPRTRTHIAGAPLGRCSPSRSLRPCLRFFLSDGAAGQRIRAQPGGQWSTERGSPFLLDFTLIPTVQPRARTCSKSRYCGVSNTENRDRLELLFERNISPQYESEKV